MYVIIKTDSATPQYVARSGEMRSYTKRLERARTFLDRHLASVEQCAENERVVDVGDIVGKGE